MLTTALRERFNRPIFEPVLVAECTVRSGSVLVMGYAEHLGELVMLNAVGNNVDINLLTSLASSRLGVNILAVPTTTGRKSLYRRAETDFEIREKEVVNYGIKSAVIINRQLLIPGFGINAFFACDTIEKAVEMVGERIKHALDTSVIPAWYEYIFKCGVEGNYVRQLPGSGINAYLIDTDPAFWQSVISSGLASKVLSF